MNTSRKGAAYEAAYRKWLESELRLALHREKLFWQPPKPRQHSTGFDSMSWIIRWDDEGDVLSRSEPTLYEFKAGKMSCLAAHGLREFREEIRPAFVHVAVVHRTKEREFCEH